MNHVIRFARTNDDICLAYALSGSGSPVLLLTGLPGHVEKDLRNPALQHVIAELAESHMLLRYDLRGCGLSQGSAEGVNMARCVKDLHAVLKASTLERLSIVALSRAAALAFAYGAEYPQHVSKIVICGSSARTPLVPAQDPQRRAVAELTLQMLRYGWENPSRGFHCFLASLLIPDASQVQLAALADTQRNAASSAVAVAYWRMIDRFDLAPLLPRITCPVLVLHAEDDELVPFGEGQLLAASLPDARFVPLPSANHYLLPEEAAWQRWACEVRAFLQRPDVGKAKGFDQLSRRERQILAMMCDGLNNVEIAAATGIKEKTVRNHNSSLYSKLQVRSRPQAVALAHRRRQSHAA
jgi:pimeloyl-ACP methyl ester carboxylesterase/DNA-binding CsgD family transcriptional regulator